MRLEQTLDKIVCLSDVDQLGRAVEQSVQGILRPKFKFEFGSLFPVLLVDPFLVSP